MYGWRSHLGDGKNKDSDQGINNPMDEMCDRGKTDTNCVGNGTAH